MIFLLDNRSVAAIILSEMSSDLEIPIINDCVPQCVIADSR